MGCQYLQCNFLPHLIRNWSGTGLLASTVLVTSLDGSGATVSSFILHLERTDYNWHPVKPASNVHRFDQLSHQPHSTSYQPPGLIYFFPTIFSFFLSRFVFFSSSTSPFLSLSLSLSLSLCSSNKARASTTDLQLESRRYVVLFLLLLFCWVGFIFFFFFFIITIIIVFLYFSLFLFFFSESRYVVGSVIYRQQLKPRPTYLWRLNRSFLIQPLTIFQSSNHKTSIINKSQFHVRWTVRTKPD